MASWSTHIPLYSETYRGSTVGYKNVASQDRWSLVPIFGAMQVQLHWNVRPCARHVWSFKTVCLRWQWSLKTLRLHCTWIWSELCGWKSPSNMSLIPACTINTHTVSKILRRKKVNQKIKQWNRPWKADINFSLKKWKTVKKLIPDYPFAFNMFKLFKLKYHLHEPVCRILKGHSPSLIVDCLIHVHNCSNKTQL